MNEDNVKKLFLHRLLNIQQQQSQPMTLKEEREILDRFSQPDFPDEISFSLSKNNFEPGKLFSQDALERFLRTIRLYIGGRIMGDYDKTKKEPEVCRVTITIEHLTHKEFENEDKSS
jgi:hypothetical protein